MPLLTDEDVGIGQPTELSDADVGIGQLSDADVGLEPDWDSLRQNADMQRRAQEYTDSLKTGDFARALFTEVPGDIAQGADSLLEPAKPFLRKAVNTLVPGAADIPDNESLFLPPLDPNKKGFLPSIYRQAEGLTTKENIAMLPLVPESEAAKLLFQIPAAAGAVGGVSEMTQAKSPEEFREALGNTAGNALFAHLLSRGHGPVEAPEVTSPETRQEPAGAIPGGSKFDVPPPANPNPITVTPDIAKDLIEQLTKGQIRVGEETRPGEQVEPPRKISDQGPGPAENQPISPETAPEEAPVITTPEPTPEVTPEVTPEEAPEQPTVAPEPVAESIADKKERVEQAFQEVEQRREPKPPVPEPPIDDLEAQRAAEAPQPDAQPETAVEDRGAAGGNVSTLGAFDPANWKGAIEFGRKLYGHVKDFGAWSAAMLHQFGEHVREHLQNIHEFIKSGFEEANRDAPTEASRDTSGDLGLNPFHRILEDLPDHAKLLFRSMDKQRQKIVDRINRAPERDVVSHLKDSSDNRATIMGRQAANMVRHELNRAFGVEAGKVKDEKNDLRESALTVAIEAGGERSELGRMRQALTGAEAEGVNQIWKRRALRAIDFAEQNWDRLRPVVDLYGKLTDAENAYENSKGVNTLYRKGGYVFHAQDIDETYGIPSTGSAQGRGGAPAPFKHVRDYNTYADAIGNGVTPKSLSAVDLLQKRVAMGQRLVNYGDWMDAMKEVKDRRSDLPIVTEPNTRMRADQTPDVTAPPGYSLIHFAGRDVALHNGYTGLFGDLTRDSVFKNGVFRQAVVHGMGLAKHGMLLFDTYHMGRLAFWNAVTRIGMPGYERGFTLLDNSLMEIQRMISRGEIPEEWGKQLIEDKKNLGRLLANGMNVGHVGDNLHTDLVQSIPGLGTFNKWLFGKYQRGAMAEVGLIEMQRQAKMFPDRAPDQLARRVAKDVNTRFGNLQSQGVFKSKTFQDLARIIFLAPQWNESLIRAEIGAVRQAAESVKGLTQRKVQMGALARGVGAALLGTFIANQIINYGTRGHPTWENPEEGFGSKISAWIPDSVGGGPGFFLNPMSLPAEITNLLWRSTERHGGDIGLAMRDFLAGRFSALTKGIYTAFSGQTPMGVQAKSGADRAKLALGEALPLPISGGALVRAGKQLVTGQHEEKFPGQFEKQAFQTGGVKLESAPSPEQRMFNLAKDFNREHKVQDGLSYPPGRFSDLIKAVRLENTRDAKDALESILSTDKANGEPTNPKDVYSYFKRWERDAFTGSQKRESQFRSTLNPEQRSTYDQARKDRGAIAKKVNEMLRAWMQLN